MEVGRAREERGLPVLGLTYVVGVIVDMSSFTLTPHGDDLYIWVKSAKITSQDFWTVSLRLGRERSSIPIY